jgi:hypothetical protein
MRIFRKRKKFGNFHGAAEDAAPLPDIVYQMGAEQAARYAARNSPGPPNHYGVIDPYEQEGGYDFPPGYGPIPGEGENPFGQEMGEEVRASSPLQFLSAALGIGRSRPRDRYSNNSFEPFARPGSPHQFGHRSLGSPVKFRRRPQSPEFLQQRPGSPYHFVQQERVPSPHHFQQKERASSPYHFAPQERAPSPLQFAQHSRPGSPDVARRLQRAQLSQDLQRMEKHQRREQEMMMEMQFNQQAQQPFYPLMNSNGNMHPWHSMQQPMYSYY